MEISLGYNLLDLDVHLRDGLFQIKIDVVEFLVLLAFLLQKLSFVFTFNLLLTQDIGSLKLLQLFFEVLMLDFNLTESLNLVVVGLSLGVNQLTSTSFITNLSLVFNLQKFSLFGLLLTEFSLHILEKSARANFYVSDFNSLKPDTPALDNFGHFVSDSISESLTVFDDFIDS